jgi:glycogen synthase
MGVRCRFTSSCVVGSHRVLEGSANRASAFAPPTAPLPRRLRAARRAMVQVLWEDSPDLLASHFGLFTWPILDLIRQYPLAVHFHDPWSSETAAEEAGELKRRAGHVIERAVYRRAARLITVSRAFAEVLCRSLGIPQGSVRIIPSGDDAQRFAVSHSPQQGRAEFALPNDRPIIVTVRRLARRMGLEDLLEAIALITLKVPEVLLVIAGSGPLGDCLKARVPELGLQANIRLLPLVSDESLPLLYRAATIKRLAIGDARGIRPRHDRMLGRRDTGIGPASRRAAGGGERPHARAGLPGTSPAALADGLLAALDGRLPLSSAKECQDYVRARFDWPVVSARARRLP